VSWSLVGSILESSWELFWSILVTLKSRKKGCLSGGAAGVSVHRSEVSREVREVEGPQGR
jgi:hypothetical protein